MKITFRWINLRHRSTTDLGDHITALAGVDSVALEPGSQSLTKRPISEDIESLVLISSSIIIRTINRSAFIQYRSFIALAGAVSPNPSVDMQSWLSILIGAHMASVELQFPSDAAEHTVSTDSRTSAPLAATHRTPQEVVLSRDMRRAEGIRVATNAVYIYFYQLALGAILLLIFE